MRHIQWKLWGVALFLALVGLRCAPPKRVPSLVKPTQVEVEGAKPLIVSMTRMRKRPLRPGELTPFAKAGSLWEYQVTLENPSEVGVNLDRLLLTVQNLWGASWGEDQPLNLRLEEGSERKVAVQARLTTTDPQDRSSLTGVQTLNFLGRDDDGGSINFTVRVPLD
ncbi:MAG: hypothetical protein ACE5G5_03070 [Candidatus Methylomirabilales bacterium]